MNIIIKNIDSIEVAAQQFVQSIGDGRIFAFYGSMGAGKTTFIKAVCKVLGVGDTVTSPTFAIVNEYHAQGGKVFHFDFYRIKRLSEAYDIGFDDYLDSGQLCFIEWPELIEDLLPAETIRVTITEQADGSRVVHL